MPFLSVFIETAQRVVAFFDRRRGLLVVLVAAALLVTGTTTVAVVRPPVLAPVLDAVSGALMSVASQPLKISRLFTGKRGPSEYIMELELELARLREAGRENERLRAMLDYGPAPGYRTVPGRVVGLDLDPLHGMAWIDVGTAKGLAGGEAVMTVRGLVGVVDRAGSRRSRVRLLRNENTPVSVRNTRSRVLGIVEWGPGEGRLRVSKVPFQADVAPGDTLVSSGLGGVFPAGLPVGRVTEVTDPPERLLKEISLEPFGTFIRLEEIFVLLPLAGPLLETGLPESGGGDDPAPGSEP